MTISDWLMITAILLSPFLAVFAQRKIDLRREKHNDYPVRLKAWGDKADDLLADLLYIMSKSLGYKFDKVKIKRGIYIPSGHGEEQFEKTIIRKRLVDIMSRKAGFPVEILQPIAEKESKK